MPSKQAIHEAYQRLIEQFNQARLVGNANRVPLLRKIVAALSHPEQFAHVIHIAGTNGKGSTGAMLAAVLQAAGYRVGRFSSPAILNDREQLQVNGDWISEAAFIDTYDEILPVLGNLGLQATDISIFEWQFLISLVWSRNEHVDYMIIEAGLGGLTDATNAISAPQLTIFTRIGLDHTQILGDTITKIAIQKSKIIKPDTTVVTLADQTPDALTVLRQEASTQAVPLELTEDLPQLKSMTPTGMTVMTNDGIPLKLNIIGTYQLENLALVLKSLTVLRQKNVVITNEQLTAGLAAVQLPDRLTVVGHDPLTLVDVAHNVDGMAALTASLHQMLPEQPLTWIVGVLADKNVDGIIAQILPVAQAVVTVTPDNPTRALPAAALAKRMLLMDSQANVQAAQSMAAALTTAKQLATEAGAIVISGSFYVAREVAELMAKGADDD